MQKVVEEGVEGMVHNYNLLSLSLSLSLTTTTLSARCPKFSTFFLLAKISREEEEDVGNNRLLLLPPALLQLPTKVSSS